MGSNPDLCLRRFAGDSEEPVTTAVLFAKISAQPAATLTIAGLDVEMRADLRIRHLFAAVAAGRWPELRVVMKTDGEAVHTDDESRLDAGERALMDFLATDNFEGALLHYWQTLGNFSSLAAERAIHRGARLCRALNDGQNPDRVSERLRMSPAAVAVVNDWSLYASAAGDARLALRAAQSAYELAPAEGALGEQSMVARHCAEAFLLQGRVPQALRWARRAIDHATRDIRRSEGLPTSEVMDAYDYAYQILIDALAVHSAPEASAQALDELVEVQTRARRVLANYNRSVARTGLLPLPGVAVDVDPETLAEGRPAATAAFVDGRFEDACRILERMVAQRMAPWQTLDVRVRLVHARLAAGKREGARDTLADLVTIADNLDDTAARCELALVRAGMLLADGDAMGCRTLVEEALDLTAVGGLGMLWIDLLVLRSRALLALDDRDRAQLSAAGALFGPGPALLARWPAAADLLGASHADCDYRTGALRAIDALCAAGGEVPDDGVRALAEAPPRTQQPRTIDRSDEERRTGPDRRVQLHEAALGAIEAYAKDGRPLAVYFRKYNINVTYGPMEYGPRLIENVLRDALPDGANVVTIQSHDDDLGYTGSGIVMDRAAPALLLDENRWKEAAAVLIANADVIVSECLMLSEGVRFELQKAYELGRWDRTVLVLPPLRSPFAVIDSDSLVQMFPRCIWADSLHTEAVTDAYVMKDLLARIEGIVSLPDEERRQLVDPALRDEAFPIDLAAVAKAYELEARLGSMADDEDDRLRYYGFWQLFRAASIRGVLMERGDDSFANRLGLYEGWLQMSAIQLDHETEGEQFVLVGDLSFAEQCAQSAHNIIRDDDMTGAALRERALNQWDTARRLRATVDAEPERFILRPRYGPFIVRKMRS
jgi:tetratricopeptide (TPR) repeat protein